MGDKFHCVLMLNLIYLLLLVEIYNNWFCLEDFFFLPSCIKILFLLEYSALQCCACFYCKVNQPYAYIFPLFFGFLFISVQFSSVAQSCLTLCDPVNCSTPGLPVHHQLPEFIQTHVHRVGDAIQPSHPLSSPSPAAPNPSQHQGLFQ